MDWLSLTISSLHRYSWALPVPSLQRDVAGIKWDDAHQDWAQHVVQYDGSVSGQHIERVKDTEYMLELIHNGVKSQFKQDNNIIKYEI